MLRVGAREETVTPFAEEGLIALWSLEVLFEGHWWVRQVLGVKEMATLLRLNVLQNLHPRALSHLENGLFGAV